jgi:fermentation-respiration switch protein FrsA (DUF1100 family)
MFTALHSSRRVRLRSLTNTQGLPVTAILGTDDQIVPFSGAALMQRDVAQLKLVPIGGGNHSITCTRANDVTALNETK